MFNSGLPKIPFASLTLGQVKKKLVLNANLEELATLTRKCTFYSMILVKVASFSIISCFCEILDLQFCIAWVNYVIKTCLILQLI